MQGVLLGSIFRYSPWQSFLVLYENMKLVNSQSYCNFIWFKNKKLVKVLENVIHILIVYTENLIFFYLPCRVHLIRVPYDGHIGLLNWFHQVYLFQDYQAHTPNMEKHTFNFIHMNSLPISFQIQYNQANARIVFHFSKKDLNKLVTS